MGKRWWIKKYTQEMILSRHQPPGPLPYIVVMDNLKGGFNVPKIIRSAAALGAREIHLVGVGEFDPSPAKGCLRQIFTRSFERFEQSRDYLLAEGYTIYALDPSATEILGAHPFPERTALVVGHEEFGFSFKLEEEPRVRAIKIRQFGSVQSMNVSNAASVACYEYVRQHGLDRAP